jgi:hypothetical protein
VFAALLLAICASTSPAQQAGALQPRVSPERITVGDVLTYTVEAPLGPEETVAGPGAEAALGPWEVRGYNVQPSAGKAVITYLLTVFETGEQQIPSIEITIADAKGGKRTVRTAPVKVTVASVLQVKDEKPADIVGPLSLREKPLAIVLRVLLLVVVVALAVLAIRYVWRRRKRRISDEKQRPDPPDVAALKALRALRAARLPDDGRIKQHYSEVSDIVRTYIAARWDLRTLEETTSHILAQMRDTRPCAEYAPVVEDVLREADLVKFAKARPELAVCWSAVDRAERLVRETAAASISAEGAAP